MKKRIAAEHLFCSMGLIDSSLVAAAQEPRKVRKKTASKSWLIVLAAVISSLSLLHHTKYDSRWDSGAPVNMSYG